MTTLIVTIISTGVGLAGLMIVLVGWLRADMRRMDDRLAVVEHSQAKLEGLLEGLREAIVSRAAA